VNRRLRRTAAVAALPTALFGVALVALPGRSELIVHLWIVVVLSFGLLALVAGIGDDVPPGGSGFASPLAPPQAAPVRPPSLARVEREVSMGAETAFDTYFRLRPLFRELAAGVLLTHHGVDLGRAPERARPLVSDELWSLIGPGVEAPEDRAGRGMPHAQIASAVSDLERLAWS